MYKRTAESVSLTYVIIASMIHEDVLQFHVYHTHKRERRLKMIASHNVSIFDLRAFFR